MEEIFKIMPIGLYFLVGIICLSMSVKILFSKKFLPFHEEVAGKKWSEIENRLKLLILSFLKLIGLGFLIVSILLIICPIVNYFSPNIFYKYFIPAIALIWSIGLFVINYSLYKNTKVDTPWKGSLYAIFILIAGLVISLLVG